MASTFQDLLQAILGRRKRLVVAHPSTGGQPRPSASPVFINLGIDFGTSYTKVCFRDAGADHSSVVSFKGAAGPLAMLPSVVYIRPDSSLSMGNGEKPLEDALPIEFLKMRLAGTAIVRSAHVHHLVDLDDPTTCRALSAWYLANVIKAARQYVTTAEVQRLANKHVLWSANMGVPVEHCDSPALADFEEVLRVAWRWADANEIPSFVAALVDAYREHAASTLDGDFHVVPEIAAAVQSFVFSREARPGFYLYFDIGGGTVDGVAFKFDNETRQVDFYSGKVEPLGLAALGQSPDRDARRAELQRLVAQVVMTAKKKDGRNWLRDDVQGFAARPSLRKLGPGEELPLIVFLGGYGATVPWYADSIRSTHGDFNQYAADVPHYELRHVPRPKDLDMRNLPDDEFIRFAIAYGLSIPDGQGPEVKLPSAFTEATLPTRQHTDFVSYADHKDVYG